MVMMMPDADSIVAVVSSRVAVSVRCWLSGALPMRPAQEGGGSAKRLLGANEVP